MMMKGFVPTIDGGYFELVERGFNIAFSHVNLDQKTYPKYSP
jgi:hypothetical protein